MQLSKVNLEKGYYKYLQATAVCVRRTVAGSCVMEVSAGGDAFVMENVDVVRSGFVSVSSVLLY